MHCLPIQKKKHLYKNNYSQDFSEGWPVFSFPYKVITIHVDVVHVTTDAIVKHWN